MQPRSSGANMATSLRLLTLAKDNMCDEIKSLVQLGANVNVGNPMGQTALHIAALWGQVEAAETLINLNADVNSENIRGTTPLHFAACAKSNVAEICAVLLKHGAKTDLRDGSGRVAYECAEDDDIRSLLGGPDPKLFQFAEQGRAEELKQLLAGGRITSVRVIDSAGRTPLTLAVASKDQATVQAVLDFDPQCVDLPDGTGNSALHVAAEAHCPDMLQTLLRYDPSIDQPNINESEYAQGNWLNSGEEIAPFDKTALHIAVAEGDVESARVLLEAGADVNKLDFDGCSPLHLAVEEEDDDMIELLLDSGADVDQRNKDFTSVLHFAASRGTLALLQRLLSAGADLSAANDDGWTPLHLAAQRGAAEKVAALLQAGADVDAVNAQRNTPLHLAALNKHREVYDQLLQHNANSTLTNKVGLSAPDIVSQQQRQATG